jgi:hypothetical protein
MADLKISQLSSATALAGTEVVPVVQGGSTKKATIDQILSPAAGKGINFSANGGDVLTQYDEGTWTPVFSSGVVTGATYFFQDGAYTRIGRQVFFSVRLQINSATADANQLKINLPFTASAATQFGGANVVYLNNFYTSSFTMFTGASSTTLDFYKGNGTALLGTDVTNLTNTFIITGNFFV